MELVIFLEIDNQFLLKVDGGKQSISVEEQNHPDTNVF